MKVYYLSHPYTGDEQANIAAVEQIAVDLCKQYQSCVFLNPLNAMRHEGIADLPYDIALSHCIELLDRCEGIIMCNDNWRNSNGCTAEYNRAKETSKQIFLTIDEFKDYINNK